VSKFSLLSLISLYALYVVRADCKIERRSIIKLKSKKHIVRTDITIYLEHESVSAEMQQASSSSKLLRSVLSFACECLTSDSSLWRSVKGS
jgi:hypothetical protein